MPDVGGGFSDVGTRPSTSHPALRAQARAFLYNHLNAKRTGWVTLLLVPWSNMSRSCVMGLISVRFYEQTAQGFAWGGSDRGDTVSRRGLD